MNKNQIIIPFEVIRWANYVKLFYEESGYTLTKILETDVNMKVTGTGGSLFHLLMWQSQNTDLATFKAVFEFLTNDCSANVNNTDDYGRTPLTLFISHGMFVWADNHWHQGSPQLGVEIIQLMLDQGGDLDVLYTPDYVPLAGCEKWRLVHECTYGRIATEKLLPTEMTDILVANWNHNLPDSNGRVAGHFETDKNIREFRKGWN